MNKTLMLVVCDLLSSASSTLRWIMLAFSIVGTVTSQRIFPMGAQLGTGVSSSTNLQFESKFPHYIPGNTGAGYLFPKFVQPATTGRSITMFGADVRGGSIGGFDGRGFNFVKGMVLPKPKLMYLFGTSGTTTAQEHTLSYDSSSGLYTQITWTTNSAFLNPRAFFYEAGTTNYLYYSQDLSTSGKLHKWDLLSRSIVGGTGPSQPNYDYSPIMYDDYVMAYFQTGSDIEFVDRASMTVAKTLTGSVIPKHHVLDNLDKLVMFVEKCFSPYGYYRIVMSVTSYSITAVISSGAADCEYSNILNFGPYQYIGLVAWNDSPLAFRIYSKTNLQQVNLDFFAPLELPAYWSDTLVQGPSEGNKFFLAYEIESAASVYNFQSYYIQFDLCSSRPGG